jgi:hypothetical protein
VHERSIREECTRGVYPSTQLYLVEPFNTVCTGKEHITPVLLDHVYIVTGASSVQQLVRVI